MFPEPTELLLIGCSIEPIWTPKSKLNTSTPKTNLQTYWPREISHVMNGIIFCVCLTLAISDLPVVLKWCRKERKKMQESQQNWNRWWIWSRDAAKGILMWRQHLTRPFSQCKSLQGIRVQVRNWTNCYSDKLNWRHEVQSENPNNVWSNLKHLVNLWA